jgi:CBS domain-containing protein
MLVAHLMTRNVEVISQDASLKEAAEKMRELDIGVLPVLDGDQLVGIVTDRDITVRATAEGRDPSGTRVREAMTSQVAYCFDSEETQDAVEIMKQEQVRRLVVLDHDQNIVGMVSIADLALDSSNDRLIGEVVRHVTDPWGAKTV